MTESGNRYKTSTEIVLKKWATEKDEHGRSQNWKIEAFQKDRSEHVENSSVIKEFVKEVEKMVDSLENIIPKKVKPTVVQQQTSSVPISAEPIKPASPNLPNIEFTGGA